MNAVTDFLLYIFVIFGLIYTAHIGLYVAGANIYDIWQYRRRTKLAATKRRKALPKVTVIVPAHNEEAVIERCLESIRATGYKKLQVIVHNDKSTDNTAKIIRAYKKRYPKFDLRLVDRRIRVGKSGGVTFCAKTYAKGELIMTLDGDCILHKDAIKNTVAYFEDPNVAGVAANVRLLDNPTVLGVLQQFEHLIGYRSKKFFTVANCEIIVGGVASTYRADILKKVGYYDNDTTTEDIGLSMKVVALGNRAHRIVYASDVVASTESAHTLKALLKQRYRWKMGSLQNLLIHTRLVGRMNKRYTPTLTLYRMPMAFLGELMLLLQPIVLGYIIFLSFRYHTAGLFLGAYLTITLYVLATIWPDEHSTMRRKVAQSLYAPILYFAFFIMDFVQVTAIIRCLMHPRTVARRTQEQQAAWTSPSRAGQQAQIL